MKLQKKLVIAIYSSPQPKYVKHQEFCRQGWMQQLTRYPDVEVFFVVGTDNLSQPSYREGDIVHLPSFNEHDQLALRHKQMCKYVRDNYEFDRLFRVDDDTYLRVDRLLQLAQLPYHYIGSNHGHRCRSWWDNGIHDYAHGGVGYLLSAEANDYLATVLSDLRGDDDVIVGGLLGKAGINLYDTPLLQWHYDRLLIPKPDNNIVAAHYVDTDEKLDYIRQFWE